MFSSIDTVFYCLITFLLNVQASSLWDEDGEKDDVNNLLQEMTFVKPFMTQTQKKKHRKSIFQLLLLEHQTTQVVC